MKKLCRILFYVCMLSVYAYAQDQFTEQTSISLKGVWQSSVAWGDYNNDGYLDILLTGYANSTGASKIYKNNRDGTFSELISISLTNVNNSSVAWGDYDNDGDLDILLTGYSTDIGIAISKIYKNNGDETFTEQASISLVGVYSNSVAWGDYDNDGDFDILLTGFRYDIGSDISKIYKNNGDGTFSEQTSISLTSVSASSVAWGDYDNDGDLDILLAGLHNSGTIVSKIYKNNGNGTFTEQTSIPLEGVYGCTVAWGDYDNDGDLDILMTGKTIVYGTTAVSKIYINNGNGTFTEQTSVLLDGVYDCSVAWGDYDNDGDLDILLTGGINDQIGVSKIYKNISDGTFLEQTLISLIGVHYSSVAWGDYDNDGDLDILLTGDSEIGPVSKIYRNNNTRANTIPSSPSNLQSVVSGNEVTFSWDKSTDNETQQNGLKYNLVIGTSPDTIDILSPMSNRITGYRRIIDLGNTNHNNSWTIKGLPNGQYYWSVQSIDNCFAGSNFVATQSFTIQAQETITITYPTDGEIFEVGSNPTITYTSIGNSGLINLDYSTDGGATWDTIATKTEDDGDWTQWIVPNKPSSNCKIRVSDADGSPSAVSDSLFTIKDVIPVELVSFTANVNGIKILLEWKTATETNNKGFAVERKYEKSEWKEIGFINGAGTSAIDNNYSFSDNTLTVSGNYSYRLKQIDYNGFYNYSAEVLIKADLIPDEFTLSQNYPNPFNPSTRIHYQVSSNSHASLKVYDVLGNEIATLVDEYKPAGNYEVEFNSVETNHGVSLPSGVYFYQLKVGSLKGLAFIQTKKMILIR